MPASPLLRHALSTISYRLGKALRGTPDSFGTFDAGHDLRTPLQLLAHINDLLDWGLSHVSGAPSWQATNPTTWSNEQDRFFRALGKLDAYIRDRGTGSVSEELLAQSVIADILTHTGQIILLRRMAGIPMRSEDYSKAAIETGRVGPDQAPPKFEFD